MTLTASALNVKVFADGADKASMLKAYADPLVKGFTTNPTLMRGAGITDYEGFARDILTAIPDRPISFEVFSDEFDEMYDQAMAIASWGETVYVKLPVMNSRGESAIPLFRRLAPRGVKMNVTAIYTVAQVEAVSEALADAAASNISVFAGRMADVGVDPLPTMKRALEIMAPHPQQALIWASTREVFNVIQAHEIGCHIITAPSDVIKKLAGLGKSLEACSLDTVRTFRADAVAAGFRIG
jgi:transaldolase